MEDTKEAEIPKTLQEQEKEYMDFPDEVDTPRDIPARIRFQRLFILTSH